MRVIPDDKLNPHLLTLAGWIEDAEDKDDAQADEEVGLLVEGDHVLLISATADLLE